MTFWIQSSLNGLSTGAIYGLIAAGFSLTYLATAKFNFGLGLWVMLGAMLTYTFVVDLAINPLVALPAITAATFALGWIAELVSVRPFKDTENDLWVVSTLAVGLLLIDVAQLIWGKYPLTVLDYFGNEALYVGGIAIRTQHLLNIFSVILVFILLHFFFSRTLRGAAFRAVATDRTTAELMSINTRRVEQIAFGAAAALAGIAGFMIVPITGADANIGTALGFKGFAVAIVGGLAAPRGVLLIGLLYGLLEAMISAYLFAGIRDIVGFSLMILALYFLPFGILGRPERQLR